MIDAERANFPVSVMCRALNLTRSSYYAWKTRPMSKRKRDNQRLLLKIEESHTVSRGTYGSPRVTADLNEQGEKVGKNRVAQLMRENGIAGKPKRKWTVTTDSKHDRPVAPNLLKRKFKTDAPNQVWVGDITYCWTYRGWVYLATVIDLYARRVVGWSIGADMKTELVLKAFEMARGQRDVLPGLIFHSDRGSQYASDAFQEALTKHGVIPSMSRKGDCWDNAVAESFFATIKRELINRSIWLDYKSIRAAIFEYIEVFYNRIRRHSTNGNISPVDHERLYNNLVAVAA